MGVYYEAQRTPDSAMPSDLFTGALLIEKINIGGERMSAIFDLLSLSLYISTVLFCT